MLLIFLILLLAFEQKLQKAPRPVRHPLGVRTAGPNFHQLLRSNRPFPDFYAPGN